MQPPRSPSSAWIKLNRLRSMVGGLQIVLFLIVVGMVALIVVPWWQGRDPSHLLKWEWRQLSPDSEHELVLSYHDGGHALSSGFWRLSVVERGAGLSRALESLRFDATINDPDSACRWDERGWFVLRVLSWGDGLRQPPKTIAGFTLVLEAE